MKDQFQKQLSAIQLALDKLDEDQSNKLLNDCLQTIRNGRCIIASGLGKNVPVCEKFIGTLNSLGIDAHFLHTNSAIHGDLGKIKPGDLVIVLSKSGETDETVYLAKLLTNRQSTNWLLTCHEKSKSKALLQHAVVLNVPEEGDPWNLVPNNSTLIFLIYLQALAMKILHELPVSLDTFKYNHPGGNIGKKLEK